MTSSGSATENLYICSQPRRFLTPPPTWKKIQGGSPAMPVSEKKSNRSPQTRTDLFHVIHKVPAGDSPYVKAKHAQLLDKDPSRAVSMFWAAINCGDRVESALKDMAVVMKQLGRSDEAIEAIKSFRCLCPPESHDSLDNILIELYKQSGRIEEEIRILLLKLKQLEEGIACGEKRTKQSRSQGKKILITIEKEYSRLSGNLAWAYMHQKDFKSAEEHYRKALSIVPDKNMQCNLAQCLMHTNKLTEAKLLLQTIRFSSKNGVMEESHLKSFERASRMLVDLETDRVLTSMKREEHSTASGVTGEFVGGNSNKMEGFSARNNDLQSSPSAYGEFQNKKGAAQSRRRSHQEQPVHHRAYRRVYNSPFCNEQTSEVLYTQPRRSSWTCQNREQQQRNAWLANKEKGGFCRKLSFEQSANGGTWRNLDSSKTETVQMPERSEGRVKNLLLACNNQKISSSTDCGETREIFASLTCNATILSNPNPSLDGEVGNPKSFEEHKREHGSAVPECKKSWADMVEEDEKESNGWRTKLGSKPFQKCLSSACSTVEERTHEENVDSNIISETPKNSRNRTGKSSQTTESLELLCTQPKKSSLSMNGLLVQPFCNALKPFPSKALNFEGEGPAQAAGDFLCKPSTERLPVFQDITRASGRRRS